MTPLWTWLRRVLAVWTAPLIIGALVFGAWSRDGWQYEWLWGMRAAVGILPLVSPVLAAAVAFDVVRHWAPMLSELGPSTRRWRMSTLMLAAAHGLWAFACVCVVWASSAVRLLVNDALWQPDPWLPIEVAAALGAATGVGLLMGMRVQNFAAPPLAAVVVFAMQALAVPYGLLSLFAPMTLVDSAVGLERDQGAAALASAMNLSVLVWCCILALRGTWRSGKWNVFMAAATAVVVGLVAIPSTATPVEFRATSSPRACVSEAKVRVCGPENSLRLVREVSHDLTEALSTLAPSGLPLPHDFVMAAPGLAPSTAATPTQIFISPADVFERRTQTLAAVLARPRVCPQTIEPDADTIPLLERQQRVQTWLENALRSGDVAAPAQIQAAYKALVTCRVST